MRACPDPIINFRVIKLFIGGIGVGLSGAIPHAPRSGNALSLSFKLFY